jgi:hypothetical protein
MILCTAPDCIAAALVHCVAIVRLSLIQPEICIVLLSSDSVCPARICSASSWVTKYGPTALSNKAEPLPSILDQLRKGLD